MKKVSVVLMILVCVWMLPCLVFANGGVTPLVTDFVASGGGKAKGAIDIGDVTVWNDSNNLFVEYTTSAPWCMLETHLQLATSLSEIPQSKGNPVPGKFTYKGIHPSCLSVVTYTIPLSWNLGTELFIAAQAKVTNGVLVTDTAWGNGTAFGGKNWATYFTYTLQTPPAVCGNDICENGEDTFSCSADCIAVCGNDICENGEDTFSCSADCIAECGNDICENGEDTFSCLDDCPAECGNDICENGEDTFSCSADCSAECGNDICENGEDTFSCLDDCPAECGNAICENGESGTNCATDCCSHDPFTEGSALSSDCSECVATVCATDSWCCDTSWDNICVEEADYWCTPAVCGDGTCDEGETDINCPDDCGCAAPEQTCETEDMAPGGCYCDSFCASYEDCCSDACSVCGQCGPVCGDGTCDSGENGTSCEADCCSHDPFTIGAALSSDCSECVAAVCAVDGFCCSTNWDDFCVDGAYNLCGAP